MILLICFRKMKLVKVEGYLGRRGIRRREMRCFENGRSEISKKVRS